ncbi:MAG: hypothetical protein RR301_08115 [Clostridia bacterium]
MADIGLKYMAGAKMLTEPENAMPTYDAGMVIGKMISTNLAVTNAEGELYADDQLAEYVSEFSSADFTAEVDNITLEKQAIMYGATYAEEELQHGAEDQAPNMGIGGVQQLRVGGVQKFRTWFFAKGKASIPDWKGTTKGSSISFGTQPIKMKITAPVFGKWYRVKQFDSYDAAKAHIDTLLHVAKWHSVNVHLNGAGIGENATPKGARAVASGADFVLTIIGTPMALYDNGVESKASISGGKYTLSAVTANHDIAVIY